MEGKPNTNPSSLPVLPCCIWSVLRNTTNDQAVSALPSQVAHSGCSKGHRHNQAFGWMHNSHWIGQIFGFKYRSATTHWNMNQGSLWELSGHKGRAEGKREKEVLPEWAGATESAGAVSPFHGKVGTFTQEASKASLDRLIPASESSMFRLFCLVPKWNS